MTRDVLLLEGKILIGLAKFGVVKLQKWMTQNSWIFRDIQPKTPNRNGSFCLRGGLIFWIDVMFSRCWNLEPQTHNGVNKNPQVIQHCFAGHLPLSYTWATKSFQPDCDIGAIWESMMYFDVLPSNSEVVLLQRCWCKPCANHFVRLIHWRENNRNLDWALAARCSHHRKEKGAASVYLRSSSVTRGGCSLLHSRGWLELVSNMFYLHSYLGRFPFWLIFFKRVETTN